MTLTLNSEATDTVEPAWRTVLRPRPSTVVLAGSWIALFVLYLLVRPA